MPLAKKSIKKEFSSIPHQNFRLSGHFGQIRLLEQLYQRLWNATHVQTLNSDLPIWRLVDQRNNRWIVRQCLRSRLHLPRPVSSCYLWLFPFHLSRPNFIMLFSRPGTSRGESCAGTLDLCIALLFDVILLESMKKSIKLESGHWNEHQAVGYFEIC